MDSSRAALIAIFSFCFIGSLCLAGIAAGQQQQTAPTITVPPQTTRPEPGAPHTVPGPVPAQPPVPHPGNIESPQGKKGPGSQFIRNHPGKIGGPVYNEHVKRHPHPGFTVVENTNVLVVNNYYFVILPGGYPYYGGGYLDVDPQLDCYTWYDGDNLYEPGWYWTCD